MITIQVPAGGDLQAAINNAQPGDTILVAAGATFTGPFWLPVKTGAAYITIRSDAADASLPAVGVRIDPSYSPSLPKLVSAGGNLAALVVSASAHHWQLIGLEICPASDTAFVSELIQLGSGDDDQNDLSLVPHDLILDRCYIHGTASNNTVKRGISLQSASTTVRNCYISEIHIIGTDTQAVCGWNGPGPYTIDNNYLEAAGENVMFGGDVPRISGLVPSDITITNNHFFKPLRWRVGDPSYAGTHWSVKNLFEIKNARRVTIDGNLFENCWADAQNGICFNLNSYATGSEVTACDDITITNNIIRHCSNGISVSGQTNRVNRVTVRNNLWEDISRAWGADGRFVYVVDHTDAVTIENNTCINDGDGMLIASGLPSTNFIYRNNIAGHGDYGVHGDGSAVGQSSLADWFPGCIFDKNVLVGHPEYAYLYPPGNFFPADWSTAYDYGSDIGYSASTPPVVTQPALSSLTIAPTTMKWNGSAVGTVTLTAPAPAGGAVVALTGGFKITVPASVTIAAGSTSARFTIKAGHVKSKTLTGVTAKYGGAQMTAGLTLTP